MPYQIAPIAIVRAPIIVVRLRPFATRKASNNSNKFSAKVCCTSNALSSEVQVVGVRENIGEDLPHRASRGGVARLPGWHLARGGAG
jgi:hypothetical protein